MSAPRNAAPDQGELQQAMHAVHGLFTMLSWFDDGSIDFSSKGDGELLNVRGDLVEAGRILTEDLLRRF